MEPIIEAGAAVHAGITDVLSFVMLAVAPFNLVKGILVSFVTMLLYKRVSVVIKNFAGQ